MSYLPDQSNSYMAPPLPPSGRVVRHDGAEEPRCHNLLPGLVQCTLPAGHDGEDRPDPVPGWEYPPTPPRMHTRAVGPVRRVNVWAGGWPLYITLSCGHTIYGEFARGRGTKARCPMCAGCGPRMYVAAGRRGYDIRDRSTGRPPVLEQWQSRAYAEHRCHVLNGHPVTPPARRGRVTPELEARTT